jgi:hypothetical protein
MRRSDTLNTLPSTAEFHGSRFRQDRFFYVPDAGWYLETRSGDVGPFSSHDTAEHFLEMTYKPRVVH